jgi:hypothetical protein
MRMPDGGFRPAFNLQMATDVDSQVIVGVAATNKGSDAGLAVPMFEQVEKRLKARPKAGLFDNPPEADPGGYHDSDPEGHRSLRPTALSPQTTNGGNCQA